MIHFKDLKKGQEIKSDQLHPFILCSGKLLESPKQGKGLKKTVLIDAKGSELGFFDEAGSVYSTNIKLAKVDGNWTEVTHALLNYYSQTKMAKGEKFGYKTAILHLAPFTLSGKNVCPKASPECAAACLNTSGRGQMGSVQKARLNKTHYFWTNKNGFLWDLSREIEQLKKRAANQGFKFAVRLNGTSDLAWHRMKVDGGSSLMQLHPDVQFYDYTKVLNYIDHDIKNYHVTFSDSGRNDSDIAAAVAKGSNVAVVFQDKLPKKWLNKKVINGDLHDLRFKDPRGVIVGLVAKGQGRKINNKFIKAVA